MSIENQKHHQNLPKLSIETFTTLEFCENDVLLKQLNELDVLTGKKEKIIWMIDTHDMCHCHILTVTPIENFGHLIEWKDDEISLERGLVSLSVAYSKDENGFANLSGIEKLREGIEPVNPNFSLEIEKRIGITMNQLEAEKTQNEGLESEMIRGTEKEVVKKLYEWKKSFNARKIAYTKNQADNFKNLSNVEDDSFDDINFDELF